MKSLTWFGMGMIVLAQSGFAMPGLDQVQQKLNHQFGKNPAARRQIDSCTDFSGTWKGVCKVDEVSQENTLEVKQEGCDSIQTGSDSQFLGGLKTQGDSNPKYALGFTSTSDWNAAHTEIQSHYAGIVKSSGATIPLHGKGGMKLEGGKLVADMEILGFHVSCIYDKQ